MYHSEAQGQLQQYSALHLLGTVCVCVFVCAAVCACVCVCVYVCVCISVCEYERAHLATNFLLQHLASGHSRLGQG